MRWVHDTSTSGKLVIDEAKGESSQIRYHSPVLQRAMDGLLAAHAGWRTVAVLLARLPDDEARQEADAVLRNIPQELRSADSQYSRDPYRMLAKIRDRVSGKPVERKWLRTYAETLRGYHRHPETKSLYSEATESGPTQRRHILVETIEDIGKEADKWDEDEPLGADDEFTVSYGLSVDDESEWLM